MREEKKRSLSPRSLSLIRKIAGRSTAKSSITEVVTLEILIRYGYLYKDRSHIVHWTGKLWYADRRPT